MKTIAILAALLLCSAAHAQNTTVAKQYDGSYTTTTSNPDGSYTYGTVTKEPGGYYATTTSRPDGGYNYGTVTVQPSTTRSTAPAPIKIGPIPVPSHVQPYNPHPLGYGH